VTAAPPEIVCEGGRVSRGQCTCPRGSSPVPTGFNSFRCTQVETPQSTPQPQLEVPREPLQIIPRLQIVPPG
jgi:hypothetical protein